MDALLLFMCGVLSLAPITVPVLELEAAALVVLDGHGLRDPDIIRMQGTAGGGGRRRRRRRRSRRRRRRRGSDLATRRTPVPPSPRPLDPADPAPPPALPSFRHRPPPTHPIHPRGAPKRRVASIREVFGIVSLLLLLLRLRCGGEGAQSRADTYDGSAGSSDWVEMLSTHGAIWLGCSAGRRNESEGGYGCSVRC